MPGRLTLDLTRDQEKELCLASTGHKLPYVRERATALLRIAVCGESGRQVATKGLHWPRRPDTIYEWVRRYREEGMKGLLVRPGRGRKPAFSPSVPRRG